MTAISFSFQVHQPLRLRPYSVFDIGVNHLYEDVEANQTIMRSVAEKSYLPMNTLLLSLIKTYKGAFKVSFSISGTALDQFALYTPEVVDSFKELAKTKCVEFIDETDSHSLAYLYSTTEFRQQVAAHRARMQTLFGVAPVTFRNTELIYNNNLAKLVESLGYDAILAEGADHMLGWRSPNFVYQPASCHNVRLLLRNYQLSDDIAFRFSDTTWAKYPLTADTYAAWLHATPKDAHVLNIFMDYETFGQHHNADTGIFEFMRALPAAVLKNPNFTFATPGELVKKHEPVAKIDVPHYVSWAGIECDLSAWLGNDMQLDAIEALYRLESAVASVNDPALLAIWRGLQTSDHFYHMSTKWLADGEVQNSVTPYASPYDAYINYMNVLADFEMTLATHGETPPPAQQKTPRTVKGPVDQADIKPTKRSAKPEDEKATLAHNAKPNIAETTPSKPAQPKKAQKIQPPPHADAKPVPEKKQASPKKTQSPRSTKP